MPKYLMLDHGGVLDDRIVQNHTKIEDGGDLVLGFIPENGYRILKDGVYIVDLLNKLVKEHDYQIIFHSQNIEKDQIDLLEALKQACKTKGCKFPPVYAMSICDPEKYPGKSSDDPVSEFQKNHHILKACYGISTDEKGKPEIRAALAKLLEIHDDDKIHHIVFDDGSSIVEKAREEKYQAYLIGDKQDEGKEKENDIGEQPMSLCEALQEVYDKACAQPPPPSLREDDPEHTHVQDIKKLINKLQLEINSSWPYPNKVRKAAKVRFLKAVLEDYRDNHQSIKESIVAMKEKYPVTYDLALKGDLSTRTRDLLERLYEGKLESKGADQHRMQ